MKFNPQLAAQNILQKSRPDTLKVNTNSTDKLLFAYVIDFVCFIIVLVLITSSVKKFGFPTFFEVMWQR